MVLRIVLLGIVILLGTNQLLVKSQSLRSLFSHVSLWPIRRNNIVIIHDRKVIRFNLLYGVSLDQSVAIFGSGSKVVILIGLV